MKKFMVTLMMVVAVGMTMVGCSGGFVADYSTEEFEAALNNGEDVTGKTVVVKVNKLEPNSAFGYNMQAGKHLNFVSAENPNVEEGDEVVVTVEKAASMFGSWIITYKK